MTQKRFYLPELDGLRFFAFLLVFLHHHPLLSEIPYVSYLHTRGWIGVDLFFCLSAFLFTKLLIAEYQKTNTISFKKFYIRRLFRIWPVYFVFTLFCILLFLNNSNITDTIFTRIIGLFTFTDNIMTALDGYNPIPFVPHLWTIAYEEQFYILTPLIILLLIRLTPQKRKVVLLAVFVIFCLIRAYLIAKQVPHPAVWVLPFTHFEAITLGIVIGFGGMDFIIKKLNTFFILLLCIVAFIALCILPNITNISHTLFFNYLLIGIATSFSLLAVLKSTSLKKICASKICVYLGKRSYGLYLYHLLGNWIGWQTATFFNIENHTQLFSFVCSFFFTVLISIISYQFLETPFLRWKKRFEVISSRPI